MSDPDANSVAEVTVLVAHGSRSAVANETHLDLCRDLSDRLGRPVRPAFLELAEPSIEDAVDEAAAGGAEQVTVLPYFLLPGNHTGRDIPAAVDAARLRHPTLAVSLARYLGAEPAIVDLVADVITRGAS